MASQTIKEFDAALQKIENIIAQGRASGSTVHHQQKTSAGPPPPPPPSLPTNLPTLSSSSQQQSNTGGSMSADLLNEINQGRDILKKLKPAGTTQVEHKEKPLNEVQKKETNKAAQPVVQKDPKRYLEKDTWKIENFIGDHSIVIEEQDISMRNAVQINDCQDCTVTINGKLKAIVLSNCKKVNVIFDKVVSNVECILCKKIQVLCRISCPSMNIDQCTDVRICLDQEKNCDLYLSLIHI
eukprot:TRINITY_DN983_c0_g1_i11.p1 TRINITY_DN983_c0_g1~~TRINITY_DN983_c0_g1_i11.p1  ORF type:complete len:240 (-),score=50.86 TRINITY_DN983_c0_g1_i11:61-780(-)